MKFFLTKNFRSRINTVFRQISSLLFIEKEYNLWYYVVPYLR